jgi:hypothetical protein
MMKTKDNKSREMGLDDPYLGPRLALPGVTRFVRLSALANLSFGLAFVSASGFLLGVGFAQSTLAIIGGIASAVALFAGTALSFGAVVLSTPTSLPGPRVGGQE